MREDRREDGPERQSDPACSFESAPGAAGAGGGARVALTGAGGFIGSALAHRLAARGARLRGLFREHDRRVTDWLDRGHEAVVGDLGDRGTLVRLLDGVGTVHHLAARNSRSDPEESRRVNVEGTERLARAAAEVGVRRLVYVSSISVYAATAPADGLLSEEVIPERTDQLNPYSRTKYEGELELRRLGEAGEAPPWTIVRPTNVWGPGARAWVDDWLERIRRVPVVPGGDVPIDLVHLDDLVEGLARVGESDAAVGETFHLGHETLELGDWVQRLGRILLGRRVLRLPGPLDLVARWGIEQGYRLLHGSRRSTPLLRQARVSHDRARRRIGWDPSITVDAGLAAMAPRTENEGREPAPRTGR